MPSPRLHLMPEREPQLERSLPSAPDAERAILAAIILNNALFTMALMLLEIEDFYIPSHRRIFEAMAALFADRQEITPILIAEELRRNGELETVGGILFLTNLTNGMPQVTSIEGFTSLLRKKTRLRKLYKLAAKVEADVMDEADDPDLIVNRAEHAFLSLRSKAKPGAGGSLAELEPLVTEYLDQIESGYNPSINLGVDQYDHVTGGVMPGEMMGFAGLSGAGKSALLKQMLDSMGRRGIPSALFSLEMSALAQYLRILAPHANVPRNHIRHGLDSARLEDVRASLKTVATLPIHIYREDRSFTAMRRRVLELKRQGPLAVVAADYFQIASYNDDGKGFSNRTEELKAIAYDSLELAQKEKLVWLWLAQFNQKAGDQKRPDWKTVEGGGALFKACDHFCVLTVAAFSPHQRTRRASLYVDKQREGGQAIIPLNYFGSMLEFHPREKDFLDETNERTQWG